MTALSIGATPYRACRTPLCWTPLRDDALRIRLRLREGLQVPPSARASALTVSGRSTASARLGSGGWPSQVRIEITRIENRLRASGGGSAHQGAAEPVALLRPDRHAGSARTVSRERRQRNPPACRDPPRTSPADRKSGQPEAKPQ